MLNIIMLDKKDVLFEPNREALSLLGLELSESLYENKVLLPIENPQGIPVRLDECFELGTVKLVDFLLPRLSVQRNCLMF